MMEEEKQKENGPIDEQLGPLHILLLRLHHCVPYESPVACMVKGVGLHFAPLSLRLQR